MPGTLKPARKTLGCTAFTTACLLVTAGLTWPGTMASAAPMTRAALAAPMAAQATAPVKWSPELGPVPSAKTHTAPALANVSMGKNSSDLFLFWTGPSNQSGFEISYQRSISLRKNAWSKPAQVLAGKVRTRTRPAASPIGAWGSGQVIAVWKDAASTRILYSIGQVDKAGVVRWLGVQSVPGAATSAGPAVYQPLHSNIIVVAWKDSSTGAVGDIVGFPSSSGLVKWGQAGIIPGSKTTGTPALAEASTGSTSGALFALWQAPGSAGPIDLAIAQEPSRGFARWTAPRPLPASVKAGSPPSAQAIGQDLTFPLLVVYRVRHGSALSYVTLARNINVTGPLTVPHIRSTNGAGISPGVLAAQAPDPGQVFYEPFVRACAGC